MAPIIVRASGPASAGSRKREGHQLPVIRFPTGKRMTDCQHMSSPAAHLLNAILRDCAVMLEFQLGIADSVTLLCRRGPEHDYSVLAEDEPPPITDARPKLCPQLPETRHYRAILRYSASETVRITNEVVLTLP